MNTNTGDWQTRLDADGILWLILDQRNTSTNVLSITVLEQLDKLLDEIAQSPPKAVVFRSGEIARFYCRRRRQ